MISCNTPITLDNRHCDVCYKCVKANTVHCDSCKTCIDVRNIGIGDQHKALCRIDWHRLEKAFNLNYFIYLNLKVDILSTDLQYY